MLIVYFPFLFIVVAVVVIFGWVAWGLFVHLFLLGTVALQSPNPCNERSFMLQVHAAVVRIHRLHMLQTSY